MFPTSLHPFRYYSDLLLLNSPGRAERYLLMLLFASYRDRCLRCVSTMLFSLFEGTLDVCLTREMTTL